MAPRAPKTPAKRKVESHQSRGTPVRLRYEEDVPEGPAAAPRNVDHLIPERQSPSFDATEDLIFMVLDVVEEAASGRFRVWGVCPQGRSVCLTVDDFEPYFYIAAPERPVPGSYPEPGALPESMPIDWEREPGVLGTLCSLFNRTALPGSQIARIEAVHRRPIMYYRPDAPEGGTYLRVVLQRGGNVRRAGNDVQKATTAKRFVLDGFIWRDYTLYEHEVAPLQRFLTDVPASAGAWLCVPPAARSGLHTPQKHAAASTSALQQPGGVGYSLVGPGASVASVDVEVVAPWRSVVCLTPDATQLADQGWSPFAGAAPSSPAAEAAAAAARRGDIAPLRVMVLDVCCATRNAEERAPVPAEGDPVVAISCAMLPLSSAAAPEAGEAAAAATAEPEVIELLSSDEDDLDDGNAGEGDEDGGGAQVVGPSAAEVTGGPRSSQRVAAAAVVGAPRAVAFVLHTASQNGALLRELSHNAHIVVCSTEAELLLTWQAYAQRADPDVIATFQVGHTLEALSQRFTSLRLSGGNLQLSRLRGPAASPVSIKKVTMYSAAWVKSQSRMSSTSNQETYRADVDGRLVVDVLRQILTSQGLGSFSMADSVASLLGQTLEVLGAHRLAALAGVGTLPPLGHQAAGEQAGSQQNVYEQWEGDALRMARYSLRRAAAVRDLLARLATLPEAFEMARAVGLTVGQVMYNAQMIRTWSLLLRVARREGVIINAREETTPLTQHTYILHPVEAGTNGIYREPVAILDFASLYPSIYRAHNMCYSTLVAPEDVSSQPPDSLIATPTGARFVSPDVRPGILPSILAALTAARATARAQLATTTDPAARAVLDSRQKAIKVCANALYGFTGAQASPLQCVPLADSCLAIGAASCRRAKEILENAATSGELGPANRTARVIYGHTDSLFLFLPGAADVADAIALGHRAAGIVTAAFPPPMELKFERVCAPLLLLHVNRYAGRAFEKESDVAAGGVLIVKGLKSMWRQAAPILRTTLHGALVRILMQDDVSGAVRFVQSEVFRLLSGRVGAHELTMTGGLWRLTGEQVASAAAGGEEGGGGGGGNVAGPSRGGKAPRGGKAGGSKAAGSAKAGGSKEEEEVRGPHAALAVRLQQRDPGRTFVLGERLPYVLTAGHRLQDAAAEDPLTAARNNLGLDYALYWKNKMLKPLEEVFRPVLTQTQLQNLVSGPHTLVKVDRGAAAAAAEGPASPTPGKGKGGSGGRQMGMMSFFKATAKCLGCRRGMPEFKGEADDAPGLCDACAGEAGKWEEAYLGALGEAAAAEARAAAAAAACRSCDSATLGQPVLCDNGECPVTYARLGAAADASAAAKALRRLDIF